MAGYRSHYHSGYEPGVHNVKLLGVPISVSYQRGGHIIWGRFENHGATVRLVGKAGAYIATFQPYYDHMVAVFHRLPPGEYYTDTHIPGRSYQNVTITPNFVTQSHWR